MSSRVVGVELPYRLIRTRKLHQSLLRIQSGSLTHWTHLKPVSTEVIDHDSVLRTVKTFVLHADGVEVIRGALGTERQINLVFWDTPSTVWFRELPYFTRGTVSILWEVCQLVSNADSLHAKPRLG